VTVSKGDAQALTWLARRLREDTHGCGPWDSAGTYAVITELVGQNLAETVHRVVGHALDPEARTPGAIRRPFIPKRIEEPGRRQPAKAGEDCKRHPGEYVGSCRPCNVEHLSTEHDVVLADDDRTAGRALREQIRARRQAASGASSPDLVPSVTCAYHPSMPGDACDCAARVAALRSHTQASRDQGPDYCAECSEAVSEWVPWPCPTTVALASRATFEPADHDRPETACAAPGCFRPTTDGICGRCRATAAAEAVQAANAELIERLHANERERARTRPPVDPGPPHYFTSADYDPERVHAAQAQAAAERSTR
jgi:hypothetical protein